MNAVVERIADLPVAAPDMTPRSLLAMAVQQGADLDRLERLMALQERWEANEARKGFVAALNSFKANPPELIKNKHVRIAHKSGGGTTEYDHATLDHVSSEIGAALARFELSHRWEVEQIDGGMIKVTCVLQHIMGHTERVSLHASRDDSGSKNNIQAMGSTITYLQRYTLLAATGMAVKGMDNDGHGSNGAGDGMDEDTLLDHISAIDGAADEQELFQAFAGAWKSAEGLGDNYAMRKLTEHKDARKQALARRR